MSSPAARIATALAAFATAICLSACSSPNSDNRTHPTPKDPPVVTGEPAGSNADDVAFANTIITNYKPGIDISALVPDRSTNPKVVAIAAATASALTSDVAILKVLLLQWNESPDGNTGSDGRGTTMKGMVDQATMAKLDSLRGGQFDTLWLQSMIGLDQGAAEVANVEIANGKNIDAVGLARQTVAARQADIGQMKQLLGG